MLRKGYLTRAKILVTVGAAAALSGCGPGSVDGAVGVGILGAGTGAIVGSLIKNGDVAASAALGGAIGIPLGIAIAYMQQPSSDEKHEAERLALIRKNQSELYDHQREIDALRVQVRSESPNFELPDENEDDEEPYLGVTLGNSFR